MLALLGLTACGMMSRDAAPPRPGRTAPADVVALPDSVALAMGGNAGFNARTGTFEGVLYNASDFTITGATISLAVRGASALTSSRHFYSFPITLPPYAAARFTTLVEPPDAGAVLSGWQTIHVRGYCDAGAAALAMPPDDSAADAKARTCRRLASTYWDPQDTTVQSWWIR